MPDPEPDLGRHPRGTLAVVGLYGLVYVVGWFAIYFFIYLARGVVTQ